MILYNLYNICAKKRYMIKIILIKENELFVFNNLTSISELFILTSVNYKVQFTT